MLRGEITEAEYDRRATERVIDSMHIANDTPPEPGYSVTLIPGEERETYLADQWRPATLEPDDLD